LPLPCVDGVYRVHAGQPVCLTIANRSRRDLHLALLDLRPDWSIVQLLPQPGGGESLVVPASPRRRRPVTLVMRPSLPAGVAAGRDLLKLIASTRPSRFGWLTQPPLGVAHRDAPPPPASPLEELMRLWGGGALRDDGCGLPSGDEWTTAAVESWMTRR
jgi:hypothetical protein